MKTLLNAVEYRRTDAEKHIDGNSLACQAKLNKEFAEKNDFKIIKSFEEQGSGKYLKRPELQSMIEFCRNEKNKVSAVIVAGISRISRDIVDLLYITSALSKAGVILLSTSASTETGFIKQLVPNYKSTAINKQTKRRSAKRNQR